MERKDKILNWVGIIGIVGLSTLMEIKGLISFHGSMALDIFLVTVWSFIRVQSLKR